jgi:hypothetical protein
MSRIPALTLTLLAFACAGAAHAQTGAPSTAKPATQATAKKPVSQSRAALKSEAQGLALATEVTESISDNQLQIAQRVLTGTAQCEFNQSVSVDAMQDKPGHFKVSFNKVSYTMVPQETTTGAVRLEDKRNGIVWLQIPSKSMMMNHKVGQRMVDSCMHAEQRAAVAAVSGTVAK